MRQSDYTDGTIQIRTPRGMESAGGAKIDPTGTFAITRLAADWYAVTHLRTGLSLGQYVRRANAYRIVKLAIASGVDWTQESDYYRTLAETGDATYAAFIVAAREEMAR